MKSTIFQLWLEPEAENDAEIIATFRDISAGAKSCIDGDGDSLGEGDWANPVEDLAAISRLYPTVTFTLSCNGADDLVYLVGKNGSAYIEDEEVANG